MHKVIRFKKLVIKDVTEKESMFIMMEDLLDDVIIGVNSMQRLGINPDPGSLPQPGI